MDDPPQTRLEWMRNEFQAARRRHLVKATGQVTSPESSDTTSTTPTPSTLVIDTVANESIERPKAELPFDTQHGPGRLGST